MALIPKPAKTFTKDPAAVKPYKLDLAAATNGTGTDDWLLSGDAIDSHTVTADAGLTVNSSGLTDTNTSITAWIAGGTLDRDYDVVFQFVTTDGLTDERTFRFKIRNT